MIARLFRNKQRLDSKDAAQRLAAIESLTGDEALKAQPALIELCLKDPDSAVRQAALMRVTDPQCLLSLLDVEAFRDVAMRRVMALLAEGGGEALADHPLASHPKVLVARLAATADPAAANALEAKGEQNLILDAVLAASRETRADMLELPIFQQADLLHELERRSRDHDKTTNRFARTRLENIKQVTADSQMLTDSLTERLDSFEKPIGEHEAAVEQKRRAALLAQMEKDLDRLKELAAEAARAGTPLTTVHELSARLEAAQHQNAPASGISDQSSALAATHPSAEAETKATETTAPVDTGEAADFDALTRSFETLDERLSSNTDFEALATERQDLTDRWLAGADHVPPTDAQHQVFNRVSHRFQVLADAHGRLQAGDLPLLRLDDLPAEFHLGQKGSAWRDVTALEKGLGRLRKGLAALRWPDWASAPEIVTQRQSEADSAEARLTTWRAGLAQAVSELEADLVRLDAHIEGGELKAARTDAGNIRKRLKAFPEHAATPLNRHLARASGRLGELSDWQTYATTPKRESLLNNMQQIAETPLAARDQADRIKHLRSEWNELGPIGRSQDHKLLDAFNEAAERAFEPCRSYFAEQAEVRAENLTAREAICESLTQYLAATDWVNTDFKAAEHIMRTARDEWRQFHPVDRTPGKKQEVRFEALQAELHDRIKAEWEQNLATKRQIVADAQALASSDSEVREKVEGAKQLQQQWKTVGTTPRRPDQTLWRDFRAACDEIFNTLDEVRKSENEEMEAAQEQARQLLAEFKASLDSSAAELGASTLRDFQNRFDSLPSLPERLARPLNRELDEILKAGQQMLTEQRSARDLARLHGLKAQDEAVSALEQRQMTGESVDITPPDPLFAERGAADSAAPVASEVLTRLTIEAEIAAGLDSVESDLRMGIQVEMMNAGRGREALDATPEKLAARWCRLGPKDAGADPLRERFFAAISRLMAR